MTTIDQICQHLAEIAPLRLAESWDNVGLLIGDRRAAARRILTCLTITPDVVDEAIREKVDLIVSHHPLPFKPLGKLTTDSTASGLVWKLCGAGIAVYSAHTAYDSAVGGINDQWCEGLGLRDVRPLIPVSGPPGSRDCGSGGGEAGKKSSRDAGPAAVGEGSGRYGDRDQPVAAKEFLRDAARWCESTRPRMIGDPDRPVRRVGVACGSGGSFLAAARRHGCDALVTGEATFHTCLEAENTGLSLFLVGHHASEWFAMRRMAETLNERLGWTRLTNDDPPPKVSGGAAGDAEPSWVRASVADRDPITVDPVSPNP